MRRIKSGPEEKAFLFFCYAIIIVFFLICVLPFYLVIVNSFVPALNLSRKGFEFFPSAWSLDGYRYVLGGGKIYRNYCVSVFVTVVGTAMATFVTAMFAYGLAHPKVKYRYALSFMTYIPMIMGSGLVGFYMLIVTYLKLYNSIWALILPYVLSPFNTFVMVSYYRDVPYELLEAGYIDGANDWTLFFKVVLPISTIPLVTVMLFYALGYWNDWWLANLFINTDSLKPLQILIRSIISKQQMASVIGNNASIQMQPLTVQLVTVCLTIGPILLVYPMIQKYFVKGITVGAVKG